MRLTQFKPYVLTNLIPFTAPPVLLEEVDLDEYDIIDRIQRTGRLGDIYATEGYGLGAAIYEGDDPKESPVTFLKEREINRAKREAEKEKRERDRAALEAEKIKQEAEYEARMLAREAEQKRRDEEWAEAERNFVLVRIVDEWNR